MTYRVIKASNMWSTEKLRKQTEEIINREKENGWAIVSVAFGLNVWHIPTVFITIAKEL